MRGYRGIKYTLFVCCYVFWVMSAVLVAVGIYAKVAKENDVVDTLTVDPALTLISVGSLMFTVTFIGCFGALRNAICLLKTFLAILAVILLLQIAAAVTTYLFTDVVMERTEKLMIETVVRYREDMDLDNVIDFIQKKFQCCGVGGYKNWSQNIYFECSDNNPSLEACGVPFSCCIQLHNQVWVHYVTPEETVLNTMCGYGVQKIGERRAKDNVHTVGCLQKIIWWAEQNLLLVGGLTAGLLLLKVCMMALAAAQISWIKRIQRQQERAARKQASLRERKDSYWFPAVKQSLDE